MHIKYTLTITITFIYSLHLIVAKKNFCSPLENLLGIRRFIRAELECQMFPLEERKWKQKYSRRSPELARIYFISCNKHRDLYLEWDQHMRIYACIYVNVQIGSVHSYCHFTNFKCSLIFGGFNTHGPSPTPRIIHCASWWCSWSGCVWTTENKTEIWRLATENITH